MKPVDLFAVVVRAFGLYLLLEAFWWLQYTLVDQPNTPSTELRDEQYENYGIYGVTAFVAGMLVLRFAQSIVNFSFPQAKAPDIGEPMADASTSETRDRSST